MPLTYLIDWTLGGRSLEIICRDTGRKARANFCVTVQGELIFFARPLRYGFIRSALDFVAQQVNCNGCSELQLLRF